MVENSQVESVGVPEVKRERSFYDQTDEEEGRMRTPVFHRIR